MQVRNKRLVNLTIFKSLYYSFSSNVMKIHFHLQVKLNWFEHFNYIRGWAKKYVTLWIENIFQKKRVISPIGLLWFPNTSSNVSTFFDNFQIISFIDVLKIDVCWTDNFIIVTKSSVAESFINLETSNSHGGQIPQNMVDQGAIRFYISMYTSFSVGCWIY